MAGRIPTPLAIIGMACRLPGAENLERFWTLVREGRDAVGVLPAERLDQDLYFAPQKNTRGKTYTKIGATVDLSLPDMRSWPLSDEERSQADHGHLLLCHVAAEACRHAGFDPFDLPLRNTGVYIGHTRGSRQESDLILSEGIEQTAEYLRDVPEFAALSADRVEAVLRDVAHEVRRRVPARHRRGHFAKLATHMAAAHLSRLLGLTGPSMVLNAACASSLHALAVAGRALELGRIDMALVGGASYSKPDTFVLFSQAQSTSATGSRPFDRRADGLVIGEGYVAILVKTLARARADGDRILAVVRSIGISSDGRGRSLWAPSEKGQIEAIRRAYAGQADLRRLQYLEAHATSTQRGDATELAALASAIGNHLPPGAKIPLGSVKANIGHTLEAAGLAGLVKTVLAMRHETIPRQIHREHPHPGVDWSRLPFFLPEENLPWPAPPEGSPRMAAVNAFGIGGLNAHVVLEQYLAPPSAPPPARTNGPTETRIETAEAQDDAGAIAVVGASGIFPGAHALDAFWDLLITGRDPKTMDGPHGALGGFLKDYTYDWRRHKIPPKHVARANPLQFMILDAVDAALRDAGYDARPFDNKRTGVVVGTAFAGDFSDQLQMSLRLPDFQRALAKVLEKQGMEPERIHALVEAHAERFFERLPVLLDETGSFTTATLVSRITKTFDLMGSAVAVDAGWVSALAAVHCAFDMLVAHECDLVICAAGQRRMGLPGYAQLAQAGLLASGPPRDPLDAGADGCVPGEGVGVVLLRRLADARRENEPIRAILRGVGAGHGASRAEASRLALARAHRAANAAPDRVTLVETAGSGRSEQDNPSWAALAAAYGAAPVRPRFGSVVGQIGHTQAASGMVSLITAMLALEHRRRPGVFSLERPVSPLEGAARGEPLAPHDSDGRLWAAVNGSDPSGAAYHVVVERPLPAAIAAGPRPRIAFLFPGREAPYAGMLRPLVRDFAPARAAMQRLDAALDRLGFPDFADLAWEHAEALGVDPWRTELACLVASTILAESLGALGIRPDRISGSGAGMYPALVTAGAWTFESAALAIDARCAALEQLADAQEPSGGSAPPAQAFASIVLRPPRVPTLCDTTVRYVADPVEIRRNLTAQWTMPSRYDEVVRRLTAERNTIFIEVGPGETLTALHRQLVEETPAAPLATDHPQRGALEALNRARDCLAAFGVVASPRATSQGRSAPATASEPKPRSTKPVSAPFENVEPEVPPVAAVDVDAVESNVCRRYLLRMVERPLPAGRKQPAWEGAALILGDNPVVGELRARLARCHVKVFTLPGSDDLEATLAAVERFSSEAPLRHLFLLGAHDKNGDDALGEAAWNRRRSRGALLPYYVCQRWFQLLSAANLVEGASVAAATPLGGHFGFAGPVHRAESGAVVGLLKSLGEETHRRGWRRFVVRAVDTAADASPADVASYLLDELAHDAPEIEVGYADGARRVVWPSPAPAPKPLGDDARRGGVWVVTGGARGVTAVAARALGKRFRLRLHLIGSSPPPEIDPAWHELPEAGLRALRAQVTKEAIARGEVPIARWRRIEKALEIDANLRQFARENVAAAYHACDVGDRAALAEVLASVRAADGPIEGVLHGAGVERACRFEKKDPQWVRRTLAAKVDGAVALMELTRDDPLRHFLAFGSISGRFGGQGQTDYCLANEMLAKLVDAFAQSRPDCRATTVQWHSWDEVGMAVRPETLHEKRQSRSRFMPPREGVEHLIRELSAGLPEREVLITDWRHCKYFRPGGAGRLLDEVSQFTPGRRLVAEMHLDPTSDPFLAEHRFKGKPIMPAVIAIESFAEAAALLCGGEHLVRGLRDVAITNAIRWFTDRPITARVSAERTAEGIVCRLTSDFFNRAGKLVEKDRVHLTGIVDWGDDASISESSKQSPLPGETLPRDWDELLYPGEDATSGGKSPGPGVLDIRRRETFLSHGPPLRCLRQVHYEPGGGWGRVAVPEETLLAGGRCGNPWLAAPAVLDASFLACGLWLWTRGHGEGTMGMPQSVGALRLGARPRKGEICTARLDWRGQEGEQHQFDLAVHGDDGREIARIERYRALVIRMGESSQRISGGIF